MSKATEFCILDHRQIRPASRLPAGALSTYRHGRVGTAAGSAKCAHRSRKWEGKRTWSVDHGARVEFLHRASKASGPRGAMPTTIWTRRRRGPGRSSLSRWTKSIADRMKAIDKEIEELNKELKLLDSLLGNI